MKKLPKILVAVLLVLTLLFSVLACAEKPTTTPKEGPAGETYNLVFTVHSGPQTSYAQVLNEWAADLKEKSNGRLIIDIYYGGTIAAAPDAVEFVQQGGADITWNTVSLNASKFSRINVLSLYGEQLTSAPLATYVYKNLYKKSPAISSEFDALGLKVLGLHCLTPSLLAGTGKKLETLADFKGVSIMSISKTCISVLDAFGAAVIGVTPGDLYENYSKNVVSASLLDGSLYVSTKLYEHIKYLNTYNYNTALCFIVMNQKKYNSLPADLQKLLDSGFDTLSEKSALYANDEFKGFIDGTVKDKGIESYNASPEVIAAIEAELDRIIKAPWIESCKAAGYDPDEIQALVAKLIEEGRAQYGSEYDWFE